MRPRLPSVALCALLVGGLLAACGPPPPPPLPPSPPVAPGSVAPTPVPTPPIRPLPPVSATPSAGAGFAEDRAVDCDDQPSKDQMLALLRAEGLLAADARATFADEPVCAGTWQYAVINVPDHDPLQVVTRGEPDELELVTAGTEVCTVEVRVHAPAGIRVAADCVG